MGGMAGAVEGAGQAIGSVDRAKQGVAFGIGNILDATGIGALTGTGFNSAATGLSAVVGSSGGLDNNSVGSKTSSWGQHKSDFIDGLTKDGSSFVTDENGDWDISRSLARGAGKFVQNKVSQIGSQDNIDEDFAQKELKRMMAQSMVQE
jgi:hypothetical protein